MKYKLIKLLPFENSPKIGYISEPHCTQKDGAHYWNGLWFNPENYPEFWEKAEEYILLNKPCLSYGDVQEYLKVKDYNKVLDLAQSKIQQSV